MTNLQFEEEISQHLNSASQQQRNAVLEDFQYKMALKQHDWEGALQRAYAVIHGNTETITKARRIRKKQAKLNAKWEEIEKLLK